jgi:hypothetical protein
MNEKRTAVRSGEDLCSLGCSLNRISINFDGSSSLTLRFFVDNSVLGPTLDLELLYLFGVAESPQPQFLPPTKDQTSTFLVLSVNGNKNM